MATQTSRLDSTRCSVNATIGSQGRGVRQADPIPHSPFNPYVRFSRLRLTDGLLGMVTLPRIADGATQAIQVVPLKAAASRGVVEMRVVVNLSDGARAGR